MSHEFFKLGDASRETLSTILVGGGLGGLALLAMVLFVIWRDKRKGLGKPRQRPPRARKSRRR